MFALLLILNHLLFRTPTVAPTKIYVDHHQQLIYYVINDTLYASGWTSDQKTRVIGGISEELTSKYTTVFLQSDIYFLENLGGGVLKFINGDTIKIDNSYTHRNQILSSTFLYEGRVYKFGGYGFFDARNFFTIYDFNSNEWESLEVRGDQQPVGLFDGKYFIHNNTFYFLGGMTVDKKNRRKFIPNKEIWSFSLKDYTWKKIGEFKVFDQLLWANSDFVIDETFYFSSQNKLFGFNVLEKKIIEYEPLPYGDKLFPQSPIYVHGDSIHYFTHSIHNDKKVNLLSLNTSDLVIKNESNILVETKEYWTIFYASIFVLFSLVYVMYLIKKYKLNTKTLIIQGSTLKYKRKKITLDDIERKVLELFVDSKVLIEEILPLFDETEVTYSQKLRLKDEIINSLNNKILVLTSISGKHIVQERSKKDKRLREYVCTFKVIISD